MSMASQQSQLPTPDTYHYNYSNTTSQQCLYPSSNNISTTTLMNKVVIFDWDDTLYPTSAFIQKLHGNEFNGKSITSLSQKVLSMIKKACLLYGTCNVFIVTNGSKNWIQHSLEKMIKFCSKNIIKNSFGEISNLISGNCITAISAQHSYSAHYPNQRTLWKYLTFYSIIKLRNADTLISVGDSHEEYIASEHIKKYNLHQIKYLHRLKLSSEPKISCMNKQFDLISPRLDALKEFKHYDVDIDYRAKQQTSLKSNKINNNYSFPVFNDNL